MADTLVIYRDDHDTTGLDISAYVDVAQGGIDPGDGPAREPVFSGGPHGYGQQLSHVEHRNRVFQCPLLLEGADHDALNGLAQAIETHLGGRRAWLHWTREGASSGTWYRVKYGRLVGDSRYDQKLEAQTAKGRRHLIAQVDPYGVGTRMLYTAHLGLASMPIIGGPTDPGGNQWVPATGIRMAAATRNFASLFTESNPAIGQVPSIGGDGPRMLRVAVRASAASIVNQLQIGSAFGLQQVVVGFSRIPYSPVLSAASSASSAQAPGHYRLQHLSTQYGPTALGTDPWSPGGGYFVRCPGTRMATTGLIPLMTTPFTFARGRPSVWPSVQYDGPDVFRMFACIRTRQHTTAGSSVPGRVQFEYSNVRGPIATLAMRSPSQWIWYDLGEMPYFGFYGEGISGIGFEQPTGFTGLASFNFEIAAIAGLPADSLFRIDAGHAVFDDDEIGVLSDSDGPLTAAGDLNTTTFVTGYWDESTGRSGIAGDLVGEIPVLPPQGTPAASPMWIVALALRGNPIGQTGTVTHHGRESVLVRIGAYDRYTWAK